MVVITNQRVKKLLKVISMGLIQGSGTKPGGMCVEQAVSYAIENDLGCEGGAMGPSESPKCVSREVNQFKIALNDLDWSSSQARGEGLKRLAIAQLGSNKLADGAFINAFKRRLKSRFGEARVERLEDHQLDEFEIEDWEYILRDLEVDLGGHRYHGGHEDHGLIQIANLATEALQDCKCEGTKFLHLVDKPDLVTAG